MIESVKFKEAYHLCSLSEVKDENTHIACNILKSSNTNIKPSKKTRPFIHSITKKFSHIKKIVSPGFSSFRKSSSYDLIKKSSYIASENITLEKIKMGAFQTDTETLKREHLERQYIKENTAIFNEKFCSSIEVFLKLAEEFTKKEDFLADNVTRQLRDINLKYSTIFKGLYQAADVERLISAFEEINKSYQENGFNYIAMGDLHSINECIKNIDGDNEKEFIQHVIKFYSEIKSTFETFGNSSNTKTLTSL